MSLFLVALYKNYPLTIFVFFYFRWVTNKILNNFFLMYIKITLLKNVASISNFCECHIHILIYLDFHLGKVSKDWSLGSTNLGERNQALILMHAHISICTHTLHILTVIFSLYLHISVQPFHVYLSIHHLFLLGIEQKYIYFCL